MSRILAPILFALLTGCGGDGGRGGRGGHGGEKWGGKDTDKIADWRILIEAVTATEGEVAQELVTHGSLESEAMADITPEAGGVVTEIKAEEGDIVRKGTVLAVLSNPSIEAGSVRARLELGAAQRKYEQSEKLHQTGAISDAEFLEASDAFGIAKASYQEARGTHGFTRLTSPIDGTVAIRNVRIGELAGGTEAAFQVVDLSRLRVIVNLSEGDLTHLGVGQPVSLAGTYNTDVRASGSVLRISPVVDTATGTIRVTLSVDPMSGEGPHLRPGQFVEVRIAIDSHPGVVTIPRAAVRWLDGSPVAWRIIDKPDDETGADKKDADDDEPGFFAKLFSDDEDADKADAEDPWADVPRRVVERVNLTLGYTDADTAEVSAGLVIGDQVVTVGGDNLRPNAEVKLSGDPNPKKPTKNKSKQADKAENGEQG
jgi:membrane fusion protein (multidrug efflux system)